MNQEEGHTDGEEDRRRTPQADVRLWISLLTALPIFTQLSIKFCRCEWLDSQTKCNT